MRFPDPMDSRAQSLWHNRRVQRSAAFGLIFITFVLVGLYGSQNWPTMDNLHLDSTSGQPTYGSPAAPEKATGVAKAPGPADDYLYKEPELPLETVPDIPPKAPTSDTSSKSQTSDTSSKSQISSFLDPTRVALIIETRGVPHLPALLSSFIATVPLAWIVRVVGSSDAFAVIHSSASLKQHIKTGKLQLTDLPDEYPVNNNEALSATLTNLTFYSEFLKPAEWLLMFQTDSVICSASELSLDDWVAKNYTWVGAPWHPNVPGGNGGLSLRHVPSIVELLQRETRNSTDWEDIWLCSRMKNLAPASVEVDFSVESLWSEKPLGYHLRGSGKLVDPNIWGNMTRKRHILKYCPETKIILGNMALESGDDAEKEKLEQEADRKKAEEDAKPADKAEDEAIKPAESAAADSHEQTSGSATAPATEAATPSTTAYALATEHFASP